MPTHYGRNNVQKGRLKVEIDMKFAMKSLVVASMMAAGIANAATVTANAGVPIFVKDPAGSGRTAEITLLSTSGGVLTFSNDTPDVPYDPTDSNTIGGLVSAFNAGGIVLAGTPGTTYTEGLSEDGSRASASAGGKVTSVTANDQTGQILSVFTPAGATQTAAVKPQIATGGTASVGNLRVDLTNNTIYADLVGTNLATKTKAATTVTLLGQALWTFADISGPTTISPTSLLAADPVAAMTKDGFTNVQKFTDASGEYYTATANNAITGLSIIGGSTGTAFNFFVNSLGLLPNGKLALAGVTDWGRLDSSLQISFGRMGPVSDLPEPSTYALMGLGLVGLGVAARRRAK
jgi:hypothetical protein